MMKKKTRRLVALVLLVVILALTLTACGKKFTCVECGKSISKAYADPFDESDVFCEACATEYFYPFPVENFRIN